VSHHFDLDDSSFWSECLASIGSLPSASTFEAGHPYEDPSKSQPPPHPQSSPSYSHESWVSPSSDSCDSFTTPENTPVLADNLSPNGSLLEPFDGVAWPELSAADAHFDIDNTCLLPTSWLSESPLTGTIESHLSEFPDSNTMDPERISFTPVTPHWPASASASTPPERDESVTSGSRKSVTSKRKRASEESEEGAAQAEKRRRNNIAAAKCRQKKLDRISELEEALAAIQKERDDLKLQLAKREEEIRVYRDIVLERGDRKGSDASSS
jgi:hypothetical protein